MVMGHVLRYRLQPLIKVYVATSSQVFLFLFLDENGGSIMPFSYCRNLKGLLRDLVFQVILYHFLKVATFLRIVADLIFFFAFTFYIFIIIPDCLVSRTTAYPGFFQSSSASILTPPWFYTICLVCKHSVWSWFPLFRIYTSWPFLRQGALGLMFSAVWWKLVSFYGVVANHFSVF